MIAGLGIDLCCVERMERLCRCETFRKKVFTDEELAYASGKKAQFRHLAAAFAAREAFAKAAGLGLGRIGLHNVSVVHEPAGRPRLRVNTNAPALAAFRCAAFHLSISHEQDMATAVVVIERREGEAR